MSSSDPQRDDDRERGLRSPERDALDRIDESEMRLRLLEALDRFLALDLAVHVIAVKGRTAVEYRVALYPDGADHLDVSKIQEIADEFRLDFTMDRDRGLEGGWIVILYPRP